ncbi:orotidine-5'-phosphate decarboxylase [Pseudohongiella sp.]|uniref:Orotidine 5'-phosphate decarboxylase n=1 Tax=marine sediment metagenome TaxID=412755 RepID=A0A0F9WDZ4_9ZZZZ|nr:orotidine-5'-phosphate decarboxylase [Pseudohongiella sp.]HDZ09891.1 orotidine-5'-phosphate decarboxylase [Pseudohongiella sp.]HEA63637.1 orotidine-5'-phosphate decarboxylase [Pseudohongiella sp.]
MQDQNKIIIALDMANEHDVMTLLRQLDPAQCRVKVGKELFTRYGPTLVRQISGMGFDIFLDLKFHDIPNTVSKAVAAAAELGVWMLTLHAAGGAEMLRAARDAVSTCEHKPLLVAVTLLTSLEQDDLTVQGVQRTPLEQVQRLASLAQECGMDGVVCSAAEAGELRKLLRKDFLLVTPGIRPQGDAANDQKRIVTPAAAILEGSDYLVIGRPITRAREPVEKLALIQQEISGMH